VVTRIEVATRRKAEALVRPMDAAGFSEGMVCTMPDPEAGQPTNGSRATSTGGA